MKKIVNLIAHRQVNKLAGLALAIYGLTAGVTTPTGWRDVTFGGVYAAVMHIVGGIKKLPD